MKDCTLSYIRCLEICRVWGVSLSHYPYKCLRAFLVKKSVTENVLLLLIMGDNQHMQRFEDRDDHCGYIHNLSSCKMKA